MAALTLREQLEADAALDAALRLQLSAYPDAIDRYNDEFGHTPFARLYRRRRALLKPSYWPYLWEALSLDKAWIRDPMTWHAHGHSPRAIVWSLVRHLHCRYPVAPFWAGEWMHRIGDVSLTRRHAFSRVGQGTSYHAVSEAGMLGVTLTRRECHLLSVMHGASDLVEAIRHAQVAARGGPRWLARALCRTAWGDGFASTDRERARMRAIEWMCRRPDLVPSDVPALVGFVDRWPHETLCGRTPRSVLRLAAERGVARRAVPEPRTEDVETAIDERRWARSGLLPFVGEPRRSRPTWSVTELCSAAELRAEGRALQHCVASYVERAQRGECSLWSVRAGGLRVLTVEVRPPLVVQVRGCSNRDPMPAELAILRKWARLNDLAM